MIAALSGSTQLSFTWPALSAPSTAAAARSVGAPGVATGVAATPSDSAPSSWSLTARTLTVYSMPLLKPVTVWLVVVASLPVMAV